MLVDTHAHLWFPDYYPASRDQPGYFDDLEQVLARAKEAGVEKMIVPGTDMQSNQKAIALATKYPGVIYAAIGVHPEEVLNRNFNSNKVRPSLAGAAGWALPLRSDLLAAREQVVAIGEIGMDMSSEELKAKSKEQSELFRAQCELALENDLPVIIHTRNSLTEALEILDSVPKMPRGQFHCFSHDEDGVKQVLSRGFHVSFCGNITWSKRVAKLVSLVPDDRLLLETDSPFMKPRGTPPFALASFGGVKNEPANVAILAEIIAQLRGQTLAEVAKITTANAIRLFRL